MYLFIYLLLIDCVVSARGSSSSSAGDSASLVYASSVDHDSVQLGERRHAGNKILNNRGLTRQRSKENKTPRTKNRGNFIHNKQPTDAQHTNLSQERF